jgi:hypothetical protein
VVTEKVKESPTLPSSLDLVRPSIDLVKKHVETLLWLVVLPSALVLLATQLFSNITTKYSAELDAVKEPSQLSDIYHRVVHEIAHTSHGQLAVTLIIIGSIWQFIIYPATISFMLRAAKDEPADIKSSLRGGFSYFWRTLGITICTGAAVFFGLLLFIVPGFIFLRRYALAVFYGMDRHSGVFEAMRLSAADSVRFKGYIWGTFGIYILFGFISSFLGVIPVIGVVLAFIANYIYYFGFALRYQSIAAVTRASARTKK